MLSNLIPLGYLVSTAFFIFGIKRLSKVRTARHGNQLAGFGMFLAIALTVLDINLRATQSVDYRYMIAGVILGSLLGAVAAIRVQMTQMPEMVAVFNGFGGMASALVGLSVVWRAVHNTMAMPGHTGVLEVHQVLGGMDVAVSTVLSLLVGAVTLTGSLVAYAKLASKMTGNPILLPGRHILNLVLFVFALAVAGMLAFGSYSGTFVLGLCLAVLAASLILGVLAVIPIGGADMPVVISLLNSYSGIAAAMTGFVLRNNLLIVSGSLVGASGIILSEIMCKAMNRSLGNVLIGGFGGDTSGAGSEGYTNIKQASPEEMAMILEDAESVVFVPGYGLAVAQAQHVTKELANLLEKHGSKVSYAIHPVAGRMPGHMNVLLAEADVPYEQLIEMDDINPEFKTTDVAIILGANDVVNPAAINDPKSPIAGMPILNVHEARTVFIIKRSLSAGFAGIRNELFDYDNAIMVFGDAKKVLTEVVNEVKESF
ncbi:MAG TPA: NAD(P)(+) transhydrogenase (Re/Si-specific) subunit beta [Candidatus Krumholzibacteria bacterium]|nr:NAD(P)(+) transhydrogenase (Re/Si-specific) subunit beta [Candidatus Krumholzibacteria bacterium]